MAKQKTVVHDTTETWDQKLEREWGKKRKINRKVVARTSKRWEYIHRFLNSRATKVFRNGMTLRQLYIAIRIGEDKLTNTSWLTLNDILNWAFPRYRLDGLAGPYIKTFPSGSERLFKK